MQIHKTIRHALIAAALVTLAGCAGHGMNKEGIGTLAGAGLGGWAGSTVGSGSGQLVGVAVGTLAGAMIGGSVGRSMDEVDRMKISRALETSPSYSETRWRNPDSGAAYSVTPQPAYETASGPCRPYVVDAYIDGRPTEVEGTACRQPDGAWVTRS
ncbi:surface antigen [Methylohalomonas lacus]|uniref:Surface antigen n=1 Tax=Methylohalomonas lacus TaxID=398773 RepID=A0AAE3HL57_9GAMM|nr:hypothetical protein [Methylohalomonas lacus]MCS3903243.1 surface antigen [Methylohalomonas lacus]